jgi:hypothetical protein
MCQGAFDQLFAIAPGTFNEAGSAGFDFSCGEPCNRWILLTDLA